MIETIRETLINQRIGLGLAAIGRPGYMTLTHATDLPGKTVDAMRSHAFDMLDVAWKNGIRYYDVARSYGKGEEFLAEWLKSRQIKPSEVIVGSKWGYVYTADWQVDAEIHEIKYHTLENLRNQWHESQQILGDYLKIYHIHSATLESGVLENEEILEELYKISVSGVEIGLSLTGPQQDKTLEKALTIKKEGKLLFQSVQATWNLLEQRIKKQLAEASAQGLLVIVKEAMANGRISALSNKYLDREQIEVISSLSEKYAITPDQLAINAALQQPFADIVLSGAAKQTHLLSNLHVSDQKLDLQEIARLAEPSEEFWTKRSELSWT
ncbi:MAG: aldo/keto reductase [Bacteroidota bacterium]